MAKVTGPFLSIDASGAFGGVLVASKWKGRQYMRMLVTPANPQSSKQVARRDTMKDGVSYWRFDPGNVPAADKTLWNSYGKEHQISGFNRFMKFYMADNYDTATGQKVSPSTIPSPQ